MEQLNKPLLMFDGSRANSLCMSEDAFVKASATHDQELFKTTSASHIETYGVPEHVDAAIAKLAAFYARTLRRAMQADARMSRLIRP